MFASDSFGLAVEAAAGAIARVVYWQRFASLYCRLDGVVRAAPENVMDRARLDYC